MQPKNIKDDKHHYLPKKLVNDVRVLDLKSKITYGPVNSRRLGLSLGVNLLPTRDKLCSFDCVYCQYGRTTRLMLDPDPRLFPSAGDILRSIEKALLGTLSFDYLIFSGNGEPSLHPYFGILVTEVKNMLRIYHPGVKLAILSNSSTVSVPEIRTTLELFDLPIMKLDAGDPLTFACINRPTAGVRFENILIGLQKISNLVIQSLLLGGKFTNTEGEAYLAWLEALGTVKPTQVQIYSIDHPVPETGLEKVSPGKLQAIAQDIRGRLDLEASA